MSTHALGRMRTAGRPGTRRDAHFPERQDAVREGRWRADLGVPVLGWDVGAVERGHGAILAAVSHFFNTVAAERGTLWAGPNSFSKERIMSGSSFPHLKHLTPILIVDRVGPCIEFWFGRMGFKADNQVPGPDGTLAFCSVAKGDIEIMYQSRASVLAEDPGAAEELGGRSAVPFFAVDNLDEVEHAIAGAPVVKARHKTPYGFTEIYVREPGGTRVGFAQF
ncbi:MAG: hypothetical protein ABI647_12970 [Gemmatimonadota bacterium]